MKHPRKKILVMIDWFLPGFKAGGPIVSCANFAQMMKGDYEVFVFTSNRDLGAEDPYDLPSNQWINSIDQGFKVYYAESRGLSFSQVKSVLNDVNPDFVYLNSMYSLYFVLYPLWLSWKGVLQAKIVLAPRGTLYDSALAIKSFKKRIFLWLFRLMKMPGLPLFHATNMREKNAIESIFPGSRVAVAEDLPAMNLPGEKWLVKEAGRIRCIYIARIAVIKNLLFLLEVLDSTGADIELTIAGPVEDQGYWKLCQEKIASLPANVRVNYIGSVPPANTAELLQDHHIYVLPTQSENFGHSIFESLAAGRPVIISDGTPWHALEQQQVGWDISLDRKSDFVAALELAASWSQKQFDEVCVHCRNYASDFLETSDFKNQYTSLFR